MDPDYNPVVNDRPERDYGPHPDVAPRAQVPQEALTLAQRVANLERRLDQLERDTTHIDELQGELLRIHDKRIARVEAEVGVE